MFSSLSKEVEKEMQVLKHEIAGLKDNLYARNKDIEDLKERKRAVEDQLKDAKKENALMSREFEIRTQEELGKLKDAVRDSLVTSDLKRTEAIAKLEVYEKMNTKEDANTIKELAKELVKALGRNNVQIVK